MDRILEALARLEAKLDHVEQQVDDMQPRVEMLNHWHDSVNEFMDDTKGELADHRARLKLVEHTSRISAATGVVNVVFNVVKGLLLGH